MVYNDCLHLISIISSSITTTASTISTLNTTIAATARTSVQFLIGWDLKGVVILIGLDLKTVVIQTFGQRLSSFSTNKFLYWSPDGATGCTKFSEKRQITKATRKK